MEENIPFAFLLNKHVRVAQWCPIGFAPRATLKLQTSASTDAVLLINSKII